MVNFLKNISEIQHLKHRFSFNTLRCTSQPKHKTLTLIKYPKPFFNQLLANGQTQFHNMSRIFKRVYKNSTTYKL